MRRAQILERIQRDGGVSVADLARDLTVSSITVHRDLEQLSKDGLVERVHGGARSMPAAGPPTAIPPTGWEQRAAAGARREGHDRRARRARGPLGLDDLPRLVVVLPGAGAPARERARDRADAGHQLARDRLRARRRADPGDRHAGRAGPAHAAAGRPLDDRLPGRAQLRARVLLVSRDHAGRRADDVPPRAGRRHQRRQRQRGADDRADRLEQVRAGLAADDRAGARSSTRSSPTTASTSRRRRNTGRPACSSRSSRPRRRRSGWHDPSRCSPANGPTSRSSSWPPRSASGSSTASSWPAGAITSTSPRRCRTRPTSPAGARSSSATGSTAGRSATTSWVRRCAIRSTRVMQACCRRRCGATESPRACAGAPRSG